MDSNKFKDDFNKEVKNIQKMSLEELKQRRLELQQLITECRVRILLVDIKQKGEQ